MLKNESRRAFGQEPARLRRRDAGTLVAARVDLVGTREVHRRSTIDRHRVRHAESPPIRLGEAGHVINADVAAVRRHRVGTDDRHSGAGRGSRECPRPRPPAPGSGSGKTGRTTVRGALRDTLRSWRCASARRARRGCRSRRLPTWSVQSATTSASASTSDENAALVCPHRHHHNRQTAEGRHRPRVDHRAVVLLVARKHVRRRRHRVRQRQPRVEGGGALREVGDRKTARVRALLQLLEVRPPSASGSPPAPLTPGSGVEIEQKRVSPGGASLSVSDGFAPRACEVAVAMLFAVFGSNEAEVTVAVFTSVAPMAAVTVAVIVTVDDAPRGTDTRPQACTFLYRRKRHQRSRTTRT